MKLSQLCRLLSVVPGRTSIEIVAQFIAYIGDGGLDRLNNDQLRDKWTAFLRRYS